jgi:hypothetical protein
VQPRQGAEKKSCTYTVIGGRVIYDVVTLICVSVSVSVSVSVKVVVAKRTCVSVVVSS